jgi:5-methyltetrahydrofolate--homocysteine methyltransferase
MPNAGLPVSENGKTVFKFHPDDFALILHKYVTEWGVNLGGGCCGTRPDHIRVLSERLKNVTPKLRNIPKRVLLSGPQNACELDGTSSLVRIGERLNVRGSAKVRDAVESGGKVNFDTLEEMCREQVCDLGLDIIDVCLDSNLVNTENTLVDVIHDITTDFPGVMCIDSFSVEALLAAIEVYPGRPILNSISMEEYAPGLDKVDAVVGKTHQHHPLYIGLATGPKGPGVTAEEKADLARQIYEKCRDKYGVMAHQLIMDVNAFPIGSESDPNLNFAMESIRSIPLVKAIHPDLKVSMGVGNLTNGLAKKPYMRVVLTSVFVAEARKNGLDAAIINPHHYVPVESLDPAHVEMARRVILHHDMDAFAELEVIAEAKKGGRVEKKSSYDSLSVEEAICQKVKDGYKQRTQGKIHDGDFSYTYQDAIVVQVAQALHQHHPLDFINKYLMVAMKELGDGFGRGEVSLPHLLKSADVMKQAMGYIETFMRHKAGVNIHDQIQYKGVVVIGTVYQDVHSIGKDLVKTLLENYGYRVIDLGVQTPLEKFIHEAKVNKANAIGMSALLVQTSNHMITVAKMMQEAGLSHVDILIGGAPVNHRHAAYVSMHGQNDATKQLDNVFYCPSGMDGVNVMNQLLESAEKRHHMLGENHEKLRWHYDQAVRQNIKTEELLKTLPRRVIVMTETRCDPQLFCRSQKIAMSLGDFAKNLDLKTLFSLNWRYGGKNSWAKKGTSEEKLKEQLATWVKDCDKNHWLLPQAVYGIFPCWRDGDTVVLLDPENTKQEVARIPFTVVIGSGKDDLFSAAQFFHSKSGKTPDVMGLQISTGGSAVDQQVTRFKEEGDSASALLLQGLSDRVAEDMAEFTHQYLRQKLHLAPGEGTRYSPGYPGLKDIHVNQILADLLQAPQKIGITLTEAGEFTPTGTTGAVVCFHPDARYD